MEMQENLNREIAKKTKQEVFSITRKALADLASVSLEEQSIQIFITRLNELKGDDKKQLTAALNSDLKPILVRSAFELSEKQKAEIEDALDKVLGATALLQFENKPELISGIELTANGYKLAWSISEYLNSLEKSIPETIKEKKQHAVK
jgi:F-type H+-transporting ATPase subunit b